MTARCVCVWASPVEAGLNISLGGFSGEHQGKFGGGSGVWEGLLLVGLGSVLPN